VATAYIVSGWLIVQVVATVAPILELPDSLQQLTLTGLVIGFPVSVILAWIYELGPDGLRKDSGAENVRRHGRMLDFAIIGILVVALVLSFITRPDIDEHVNPVYQHEWRSRQ
jgi:membrane protease YdiL (CAAX protease family)